MRIPIAFSLLACVSWLGGCGRSKSTYREPTAPACVKRAIVNEYLIKFKGQSLVEKFHLTPSELEQVLLNKEVEWAEPNFQLAETPIPINEPSSSSANIFAEYAWARGFTGQGIKVAVVDSGVDVSHPLLKRPLQRGSAEFKSSPTPDLVDNDNNGVIDDVFGWNFADDKAESYDESGHGTHIAGIIAGSHNENPNFAGIAPGVDLIVADFMNSETGDEFNAIQAIEYSIQRGARIINNSWANFCSSSLRSAFESWQPLDVIFVNAAGNDGLNINSLEIFPANLNLSNAITVGSSAPSGQRSLFSNYGNNVFMYAPGEEILSLVAHGRRFENLSPRSGTSMSTAFVSGAVALLWSAFPEKKALEILAVIRAHTQKKNASGISVLNVSELFSLIEN